MLIYVNERMKCSQLRLKRSKIKQVVEAAKYWNNQKSKNWFHKQFRLLMVVI